MKKIIIAFTAVAFICCGLLWVQQVNSIGFSIKPNLSGAYFMAMLGWLSSLLTLIMSK